MPDEIKVSYKYERDEERFFEKNFFSTLEDAEKFINGKLVTDASMKIKVVYGLYKNNNLIKTFDPEKIDISSLQDDKGAQGKGQSAGFRPTPFNTAPRPAGTAKKWFKDEEDNEKKNK